MSKNDPRIIDIKQVGDKRKIVILYDEERYQFLYPDTMPLDECKEDALASVILPHQKPRRVRQAKVDDPIVEIVEPVKEPLQKKKWWQR